MKKLFLLYWSHDGQTRKIMEYLADQLQDTFACTCFNMQQPQPTLKLCEADGILCGAAIRYGHLPRSFYAFIQQHQAMLATQPAAFFCVNLTARKPEKNTPDRNGYYQRFLQRSTWHPALGAVFAGSLCYPDYRWFDRWMIQFIMHITKGETDRRKRVEYTDWGKVDQFAAQCRLYFQGAKEEGAGDVFAQVKLSNHL